MSQNTGVLKDLTGQRFGKLTVLSKAESDKNGQARWLCQCDCGVQTIVLGGHLRRGSATSCGCSRHELRAVDLTGKRFGSLVVLSRAKSKGGPIVYWLCQCDCGRQKTVAGNYLRSGAVTSCGCQNKPRLKDLTGQKFGRLTVISRSTNDKAGLARWLCQCDCGRQKIVIGTNLIHGHTRSCGLCLRPGHSPQAEANMGNQLIDLTGLRFGTLTVLSRAENTKDGQVRWLCQCDCGQQKPVRGTSLRSGRVTSCGCGKFGPHPSRSPDLTGQRFGSLVVTGRAEPRPDRRARWVCECEKCGRKVTVLATELRDGAVKDCECQTKRSQRK